MLFFKHNKHDTLLIIMHLFCMPYHKLYSSETYLLSTADTIKAQTYKVVRNFCDSKIIVNHDRIFQELCLNKKTKTYTLLNYQPTETDLEYMQDNCSYLTLISLISIQQNYDTPESISPDIRYRKRARSLSPTPYSDSDTSCTTTQSIDFSPFPCEPIHSDYDL